MDTQGNRANGRRDARHAGAAAGVGPGSPDWEGLLWEIHALIQGDVRRLAKAVAEEPDRQLKPAEGKLMCEYAKVCFEAEKLRRGEDSETEKMTDDKLFELIMSEAKVRGYVMLPPGGME